MGLEARSFTKLMREGGWINFANFNDSPNTSKEDVLLTMKHASAAFEEAS